ncbi:hypothetical protein ACP4OV_014848 [Aristida adscensionis]
MNLRSTTERGGRGLLDAGSRDGRKGTSGSMSSSRPKIWSLQAAQDLEQHIVGQ